MDDLIKAFEIVRPYMSEYGTKYPTHCRHYIMYLNVDPDKISEEDLKLLDDLSFVRDSESDMLVSHRFGSC